MKINEVEQLVGVTKRNIRFYEKEGLLSPGRTDNGYRDYGDADVEALRKIKLLRPWFPRAELLACPEPGVCGRGGLPARWLEDVACVMSAIGKSHTW